MHVRSLAVLRVVMESACILNGWGLDAHRLMPIRRSIRRPSRPEQDVKLLALQARAPSLPPCPPHAARLPMHVCTHAY